MLEAGSPSGYSCGTSNSAAIASHCPALPYERLSALALPDDCAPLDDEYYAVLLKALLVHGASWGDAATAVETAFPEFAGDRPQLRRIKQQFLGYGAVDILRCFSATDKRVTLLGWERLMGGDGRQFELPLPPSLSVRTELRRLTATLAWLTPTNHKHRDYRVAQLWIDVPDDGIGVQVCGLDAPSAKRGTVENRVFEGTDAIPFLDGDRLRVM